jgi:hypothetical protein
MLLAVESGLVDDKEAGRMLREAMGVQWSLLTAIQYLSGQEAIRAIDSLPDGWLSGEMTKARAVEAVLKAGWVCANAHPEGKSLTSGRLVIALKNASDPNRCR